jgi:hypothetical protein
MSIWSTSTTRTLPQKLTGRLTSSLNAAPIAEWEVRNQARMHYMNGFRPFTSTADGIAHWVETATCIAVKAEKGKLKFLFCHGTEDLLGLIARPSPSIQGEELMKLFYDRIEQKQWRQRWPHLQVKDSILERLC